MSETERSFSRASPQAWKTFSRAWVFLAGSRESVARYDLRRFIGHRSESSKPLAPRPPGRGVVLFAKKEKQGRAGTSNRVKRQRRLDEVGEYHQREPEEHRPPETQALSIHERDEADRSKEQAADQIGGSHVRKINTGHDESRSLSRASQSEWRNIPRKQKIDHASTKRDTKRGCGFSAF